VFPHRACRPDGKLQYNDPANRLSAATESARQTNDRRTATPLVPLTIAQ